MISGQAAFELMGSWDYSTVQSQSKTFAASDLGYTAFPSVPGGRGNLNDLAGNTENYYSVLKQTRYPQAVADFLTVMYSSTFVKKELAIGNLTTTTSTPNLISGTTAPYLKYQYNLIKKAPAFQLSWDQAWPQTDSNTIHTAVADYFDNLNVKAFESTMAKLTPAA
jgi:xylobiose transport system substrate-binding protein